MPQSGPTQPEKQIRRAVSFKFLCITLVCLIFVYIVYLIWESDNGYAYRQYFFVSNREISMDFNLLTSMSQPESEQKFQLRWQCVHKPDQFGDYYCADSIVKWNDMPAMHVVFWYRSQVLSAAKIDVPSWYHDRIITYLTENYGFPHYYSTRDNLRNLIVGVASIYQGADRRDLNETIADLGVWRLPSGAQLIVNMKRHINLMQWDTILWISQPSACKEEEF